MITPNYVASGAEAKSNTADISPAWPAHVVGDVALLFIENRNDPVNLSVPAGFQLGAEIGVGTAGTAASVKLSVWWCRATSAAMGAPTIAHNARHHLAQILTFRNCVEDGNPLDAIVADSLAAASTAVAFPTLGTSTDKALVVAAVANRTDSDTDQTSGWTGAALASFLEVEDTNSMLGNGGGFGIAVGEKVDAGPASSLTATLASSSVQARVVLALKGRRAPLVVATGARSAAGGPHNGEEGTGPAWPTHQAGDVGIMVVGHNDDGPILFDDAAGFAPIPGGSVGGGAAAGYLVSNRLSLFWCRATSGAMPQPVLTFPNPTPEAGQDHWCAAIMVVRGCDPDDVPWQEIATQCPGDDVTPTVFGAAPAIVTSVDDSLVLNLFANGYDNSGNTRSALANADLADFAEVGFAYTSFGKGGGWSANAGRKVAAGPVGVGTVTWQLASNYHPGITIALVGKRPSGIGGIAARLAARASRWWSARRGR